MTRPSAKANAPDAVQQQVPLNESHKNLMQSWMNLRQLDNALAEKLRKEKESFE